MRTTDYELSNLILRIEQDKDFLPIHDVINLGALRDLVDARSEVLQWRTEAVQWRNLVATSQHYTPFGRCQWGGLGYENNGEVEQGCDPEECVWSKAQ